MPEKQGWYPGKHIKGLLGKAKGHFDRQREATRLKTPDEQTDIAFERARAMPDDDGRAAISEITSRGAARASTTGQGMPEFDPTSRDSVLQMQEYLNRAGYTDKYGNQLEEDGMLGDLTTSAMRRMQGQNYDLQGSSIDSGSARDYVSGAHAPAGFSGESMKVPGQSAMGPGGRMGSYGGFEIPSLMDFQADQNRNR